MYPISDFVASILRKEGSIELPATGLLSIRAIPARVARKRISPPQVTISLKINEHAQARAEVVNAYMLLSGLSSIEVEQALSDFGKELQQKAKDGTNLHLKSFGLLTFEQGHWHSQLPVLETDEVVKKIRSFAFRPWMQWIPAVAAVVVAAILLLPKVQLPAAPSAPPTGLEYVEATVSNPPAPRPSVLPDDCFPKALPADESTLPLGYYVILGAYTDPRNISRTMYHLKPQFSNVYRLPYKDGAELIGLFVGSTKSKAITKLEDFRLSIDPDVWLYRFR